MKPKPKRKPERRYSMREIAKAWNAMGKQNFGVPFRWSYCANAAFFKRALVKRARAKGRKRK